MIGPVNYNDSSDVFLGRDYGKTKSYSEGVAAEIDREVKKIIQDAYAETEKILTENMDKLEVVAQALLKVETLDGEQFEALYAGEIDADGIEKQVREKEDEIRRENAKEAEESRKIREEEERRMQEELAKYDTDYMNEDSDRAQTITINIPKRFIDDYKSENRDVSDSHTDNGTTDRKSVV